MIRQSKRRRASKKAAFEGWAVEVRGLHKWHLADDDENGRPSNLTLCGKAYDASDRTKGVKGAEATAQLDTFCRGCLKAAGIPIPKRPIDLFRAFKDVLDALDALPLSIQDKRAGLEAAIKQITNPPSA